MPGMRYDLTRENNLGANHPIEIGAEFTLSVDVDDDGVARSATGAGARFTVKTKWVGGTEILEFTDSGSKVTLSDGNVLVKVPKATTAGYGPRSADLEEELGGDYRTAVYELVWTDGDSGEDEVLLYGEEVEFLPRNT